MGFRYGMISTEVPRRMRSVRAAVPAAPAGGGVWGWGRDGLGDGGAGKRRDGAEGVDVAFAPRIGMGPLPAPDSDKILSLPGDGRA